jgi:hypothetical protein
MKMPPLLIADGPHREFAREMMLFGQFIGSWDLEMTAFLPDGGSRNFAGEWHFAWVLEGRAVQDVLITRKRDSGQIVGFGSTIRSFDPERGIWWVVWQDPIAGEFSLLLARPEGDRIVLDGQWTIGRNGRRFRWEFSAITADSFVWEARVSGDDGETWRVAEHMDARRTS